MNRDRDSTQVMTSTSASVPTPPTSSPRSADDPTSGLSKIKATALLLKQKVAGTHTKPQKLPNKIAHPWSLTSSSRSSSFPSPTSPYSDHGGSLSPTAKRSGGSGLHSNSTSSLGHLSNSTTASAPTSGTSGTGGGIKAMIAAREDPSLSCNKMAPPGTQPAPAAQKRDVRAGMTKVQLSSSQPQAQQHPQQQQGQTRSQTQTQSPPPTPTKTNEQQPERRDREVCEATTTTPVATAPTTRHETKPESSNADLGKRSTRRRNAGGDALVPSQFAGPTSSPSTPLFMKAFQTPEVEFPTVTTSTTATSEHVSTRTNRTNTITLTNTTTDINNTTDVQANVNTNTTNTQARTSAATNTQQHNGSASKKDINRDDELSSARPIMTSTVSSSASSSVSPHAPTDATESHGSGSSSNSSSNTGHKSSSKSSAVTATMKTPTSPTTPKSSAARSFQSMFDQRPTLSPRRHTTSTSSPSSSSLFTPRHDSPAVPPLPNQQGHPWHDKQQPMSIVNPTLRQLQTPQIPMNLVQARILQQEEQKRRDEELAKIPITANLRTVKKIQAVLVDDEEDELELEKGQHHSDDEVLKSSLSSLLPSSPSLSSSGSSSASSSLGASSSKTLRPRSKTATSSTVTVSTLLGGKQRGDRNRVEPVAIPKRLADQVEHILGRKLAGKGSVLDEREKEHEEEEARKAAEPLPPIVRGQPRKRALTSAHIRNLVSSWDHKVEEAKEITTEAEQIRQFLEERSTAHAELPKFSKVALSGSELLAPLPSLPPPPPTTTTMGQKATPNRVGGHAKAASSASPYMAGFHSKSSSSLKEGLPESASAPKILLDGQELERKKTLESLASKPPTVLESMDTKRSGQVLDNKAVMSRPRRAGARKPSSAAVATSIPTLTATQEDAA